MQYGDFVSCGFNQIVNNLAKTHYRWGAAVPVVVRAAVGGGTARGAVPLAERRGLVHGRGRPEGGRARDAVRREGAPDRRLRGRQPRALPRAQVAVPLGARARPLRRYTLPLGRARRRARRHGRDDRRLRRSACPGPSRPRTAGRGRTVDRGDRPAHAAAVGPRDGAGIGAQDGALPRRARGPRPPAASAARWRRSSGPRPSTPSTPPCRGWARSTRPCPSARRWKRCSRPAPRLLPALSELLAY